jgi:hypothetical protein
MRRTYNGHSILDFGFYKGKHLGLVFMADQNYINWCFDNIDGFTITDLIELNRLREKVLVLKLEIWQIKSIGDPDLVPIFNMFKNFQEFLDALNDADNIIV